MLNVPATLCQVTAIGTRNFVCSTAQCSLWLNSLLNYVRGSASPQQCLQPSHAPFQVIRPAHYSMRCFSDDDDEGRMCGSAVVVGGGVFDATKTMFMYLLFGTSFSAKKKWFTYWYCSMFWSRQSDHRPHGPAHSILSSCAHVHV